MLAPEAGTGDRMAEEGWGAGLKLAWMNGKYLASWASTACRAARNVARAACKLGLFCSDRSIRASSAGDRNSAHHSSGMSPPTAQLARATAAAKAVVLPKNHLIATPDIGN